MTLGISVAMATFNGEKYIRQQLDSIAAQAYLPCELVVCDDGSSDKTIEILQRFAVLAPFPVRIVINEENLGFANNFLKCASLCTGEWIAFSDQDDVWLPKKLEMIKRVIDGASEHLVLVYHSAELVDGELKSLGRRLPVISRYRVAPVAGQSAFWFVGGCVMCFKSILTSEIDSNLRPRDNYQLNPGWTSDKYPWMPHDKWVCLLANICGEVAAVPEVLSLFRRHGFALTGPHSEPSLASRVDASASTGAGSYRFLSKSFEDAVASFTMLSSTAKSPVTAKRLADGARKAKNISQSFRLRSNLYSETTRRSKFYILGALITRGAYCGDPFSALGIQSLVKDFAYAVGFLPCVKNFRKHKDLI